ncbi:MAG: AAA family ATPase [Bacteroidota bacterium]
MYISNIKIHNYKGFYGTHDIELSPSINVIVGKNNSGKSALCEALSLRIKNFPYKGHGKNTEAYSKIYAKAESSIVDIEDFSSCRNESINISWGEPGTHEFDGAKSIAIHVEVDTRLADSTRSSFGNRAAANSRLSRFRLTEGQLQFSNHIGSNDNYYKILSGDVLGRIYKFDAERLNIHRHSIGTSTKLNSNASNLAQVLSNLSQNNPYRYRKFNRIVNEIFPTIHYIGARVVSQQEQEIFVWPCSIDTEREDLAVPLSESGTGVGQVAAILYVILNASRPQTIIIDEPQSFLHPGALRKLVSVIKQYDHHQYIISTHSPGTISALDPDVLLVTRKHEMACVVDRIDPNSTNDMRFTLAEVGARLSDVFGADNIMWVEGRTEELCFPLIVEEVMHERLRGTEILGVKHTGDFEGKAAKTTYAIYQKLSEGRALMPPAIGFVFDREGKTDQDTQDLERQGNVRFLERRLYENYLLNADAIAAVANGIVGFRDTPLNADEVNAWIEDRLWEAKYFPDGVPGPDNRDLDTWLARIHGAKLLSDLFEDLSEARVVYDKVKYSFALTKWLATHAPDDLRELGEMLVEMIVPNEQPPTSTVSS